MEYEAERAEFRQAFEAAGVGRRVKRGDCWCPVRLGRSYYNAMDRLVVEVFRTEDLDIEHNFEYGKPVCFFAQTDGAVQLLPWSATVSYAEDERMVVVLPNEGVLSQLNSIERLGVGLGFDESTYRLMFQALDAVMTARDGRLAHLRDICHGGLRAQRSAAPAVPVSLPWLNAAQEEAVREVLRARDVMVVHGPPGTGKTTTLVEAVCEVLRREPQVMVCAQSNTAVDWISSQLADRGVGVLRIGNPTRVTESMLAHTYEHRFSAHPDYPALWAIRRNIRQLYSTPRKGRGHDFHQKVARLRERADELELRIRHSLFDNARVIASTLAGAAHPLLSGQHYHTLFIDEAAQALEAASWIAMQKADRVVFAGDHRQLPPTVKSRAAQTGGLAESLMETVVQTQPEMVRLLTVQYRMNEALMRFSSEWFYEGRLEAAPEVRHRSILDLSCSPLQWVDTGSGEVDHPAAEAEAANEAIPATEQANTPAGEAKQEVAEAEKKAAEAEEQPDYREQFVGGTYGRVNKAEARLTLRTLSDFIKQVGRTRLLEERIDIGIISPYRAQVQYLRTLLRTDDYLRPLRKAITINTIDSFQGQERDIILVSLVRANETGNIGFLADLRRINVALTRARSVLILLGNSDTLCRHRFYRELFRRCRRISAS